MRNVKEQCNEWKRSMYLNVIDFLKTFDNLHQEILWKLLKKYGIQLKMAGLIEMFYRNYECIIEMEEEL